MLTGWGQAQIPSPIMPGEVVSGSNSSDKLNRVGKQAPRVGKPIGEPINLPTENALLRRYDPDKPYDMFKGTGLDTSSIVGPMNGYTQVAGTDKSAVGQFYNKLKSWVGLSTKPQVQKIYTPGIARRNRERTQTRLHPHD